MKTFTNFKDYNRYVGMPEPRNEHIDLGRYQDSDSPRLISEPVKIDYYRISYKRNYVNRAAPYYDPKNPDPVSGLFFYSPSTRLEWDLEGPIKGFYLQLSKDIINKHRYLFQNYMEYGSHEVLGLNESEEREIKEIFSALNRHYHENPENISVLISYTHVLVSLIESFYRRQFSTDIKKYNPIVTEFQQLLRDYYNKEVNQIPTVQYFADKLHLSPNYLGDIVKHHTEKTAIETIHEFILQKAKKLLRDGHSNMSQIAYQLGFEYPNNFSKFFKNHTDLTPSEFRKRQKSKLAGA
ncbi:helix-turn-helix domain-containing protein [Rhodohalobacter sp. 614A]|uniref:helix-turn-helix domain-containing protein n=1 Tax=Rhodohalobacter sp. 614A TaxID=2908649 RepID=UPI001F3E5CCF|nr:helix-turn-helix domain-containing protein [Rhodohalobacter sp. 614A]